MRRSAPLTRKTPLLARREGPSSGDREPRPMALSSVKPLHRGTYSGSTSGPAPKGEAYRDGALLEMARGRPCLLLVPGCCNFRMDTTVAAHSNQQEHGKGAARKADDCYSVWACSACHGWLDQGRASAQQKRGLFMEAHLSQVLAWRQIAADAGEPERFRRAACRALDHLNASPLEIA